MTNRKQKNLRLGKEYHNQLEELAEEWFNSSKKQGQVVEKLLDIHGDNDMKGMIQDIHEQVVVQSDENNRTHTNKVSDESNGSDEVSEMIELAEDNKKINPEEYDLTKIKGKRDIDRVSIIESVVQSEFEKFSFNQSDVRDLIIEEAGYQYNGANQLAKSVVSRMAELPDMDAKLESMSDRFDSVDDYFGIDLEAKDYCVTSEKKNIVDLNVRLLKEDVDKSNKKTARKIANWLESH